MEKKYRKDLSYFFFFNKLKRTWKESVGEIINDKILTDDEELISCFSKPVIFDSEFKNNRKPKKYDVYNKSTGLKIGEMDRDLDVYNISGLYIGTLRTTNTLLILLFPMIILSLALILLSIYLIDISTIGKKPVLIEVTEANGNIVTTDWNVFTDINGESMIYPGKSGDYLFQITNLNKFDIVIIIEFSEENELDIPLVYNLKGKDGYIVGGKKEYVSIEHLKMGNIILEEGQSIFFELNWLWESISNEHDTQIGISEDTVYTIKINIVAYEKERK